MSGFKQKYTLQQRIQKCKKQLLAHPDRIVLIAQKHPKSSLPELANPRFLCERNYEFNMIKKMLQTKILQKGPNEKTNSAKNSFFIFIKKNMPNGKQLMSQLYDKYRDEDGFLYLQYGELQTY